MTAKTPPHELPTGEVGFVYTSQMQLFGHKEIVGFGCDGFYVAEIDRLIANDTIRKNHYSKTTYAGSRIHLGVYSAGGLRGVLQYGAAMNPASQGSVVGGTEQNEYLELNRMWLDDRLGRNSESRAIAYSIKYIKRKHPKIAWIQSFADERCGCYGVVYQACNFIYCGEHTSTFWEIDGEWYHNSLMTRDPNLTPKARFVHDNKDRAIPHTLRQFRYIYFIDKRFRGRLLLDVEPFPKWGSNEDRMRARAEAIGVGGRCATAEVPQ